MPSKKKDIEATAKNNDGKKGHDQQLLELKMTVIKIIKKS